MSKLSNFANSQEIPDQLTLLLWIEDCRWPARESTEERCLAAVCKIQVKIPSYYRHHSEMDSPLPQNCAKVD